MWYFIRGLHLRYFYGSFIIKIEELVSGNVSHGVGNKPLTIRNCSFAGTFTRMPVTRRAFFFLPFCGTFIRKAYFSLLVI